MHIGVDLGTSGIKAVLIEDLSRVVATASQAVPVSRPAVGQSEQDADLWVTAVFACLDALAAEAPREMAAVQGIGLSGQMLAGLFLDANLRPLRPAILWNDQRALAECAELLARVPDIGRRTNGTPDPGITAPKILWLRKHEPRLMERARMLLLTKDYVRLALTGEVATEPSDAGGTQLLDCASGRWDGALCAAAGWDAAHLPPVVDSWAAAGSLRADLAARWGMGRVPVAAGAGDNMGSTLGAGGARPGDAVLTVGTSGVACIVDRAFHPGPEKAILTSAHVVPGTFLSMGVVMSATASLDWVAAMTGRGAAELAGLAEGVAAAGGGLSDAPVFLPCLTGVRTPLNRPDALGRIEGLHPGVTPAMLGYATLEGVAWQMADCVAAQRAVGVAAERFTVVGGGTRSGLWLQLIASALGQPVRVLARSDLAGPMGAARLAAVAAGADVSVLTETPPAEQVIDPDPALVGALTHRRPRFDAALSRL